MSRSHDDSEPTAAKSHGRIQDIIHRTWDIRSKTVQLLSQAETSDLNRARKAELHSIVFAYFDALRPYFKEHENSDRGDDRLIEIWEDEAVIPTGPLQVTLLHCPECKWRADADDVDLNRADPCPRCEAVGMGKQTITDPNRMQYAPLKAADGLFLDVRQTQSRSSGYQGIQTERNTTVNLLPATVLIEISRLLDEAARKLGFLPEGLGAGAALDTDEL